MTAQSDDRRRRPRRPVSVGRRRQPRPRWVSRRTGATPPATGCRRRKGSWCGRRISPSGQLATLDCRRSTRSAAGIAGHAHLAGDRPHGFGARPRWPRPRGRASRRCGRDPRCAVGWRVRRPHVCRAGSRRQPGGRDASGLDDGRSRGARSAPACRRPASASSTSAGRRRRRTRSTGRLLVWPVRSTSPMRWPLRCWRPRPLSPVWPCRRVGDGTSTPRWPRPANAGSRCSSGCLSNSSWCLVFSAVCGVAAGRDRRARAGVVDTGVRHRASEHSVVVRASAAAR